MKKFIYRILLVGALIIPFNLSYAQEIITPPKNPNSAKGCAICHYRWVDTFFIEGRGSDLVPYTSEKVVATPEMCFSCHDGSVMDSRSRAYQTAQHKTNVAPPANMKIPDIFPLDELGKVQCATCHTAHGVPSGPDSRETIFMRTSNRNSAMCRMCHPGRGGKQNAINHPLDVVTLEIPADLTDRWALAGDKKNQVICESCHTAHGSRYESYLIKSGRDSSLCLACHKDQNVFTPDGQRQPVHVVNVPPQTAQIPADLVQKGARFGDNGELICQSCHKVHNNTLAPQLLLIKKDNTSAFCLACHPDKQYIAATKHNLARSAPNEKNQQGQTVAQAGVCSACHLPHKAPRQLSGGADFTARLCMSCHGRGQVAQKDHLFGTTHPLSVYPFANMTEDSGLTTISVKPEELTLPLYDRYGVRDRRGKMTCSTCHETHRLPTDPATTGAKDKADPTRSFLRKQSTSLCAECHRDKFAIENSKHNLSKSAPETRNILNQLPSESGLCGSCHMVHGSHRGFLWARKINPGDEAAAQSLCITCHNASGMAKKKVNQGYSHPIDIAPIERGVSSRLPLFDKSGKLAQNGAIRCHTCHDPHRWQADSTKGTGGKHPAVDSTNGTTFLRKSAPQICGDCHQDKFYIANTKHDLSKVAPETQNIRNQTPAQAGLCGSCHLVHNAQKDFLWARKMTAKSANVVQGLCVDCHNETGLAKESLITGYSHPMQISPFDKDMRTDLPLFDPNGKAAAKGVIACHTCHDPHRWNPIKAGNGDQFKLKGTSQNSFLRLVNSPTPELCENCHPEQAYVKKTDHDLIISAPDAKNIIGQTPLESGTCGACHLVHNSPTPVNLWGQNLAGGGSITEMMCASCHSSKGSARNKTPRIATHPDDKLIINLGRDAKDKPNDFPLYDETTAKTVNVGNISCPSCHNTHQWNWEKRSEGAGVAIEGSAGNSFLRGRSKDMLCKECHGPEALLKYLYFHDPIKRSGKKE
jgi:predicted CXXCH cytochrome family protein